MKLYIFLGSGIACLVLLLIVLQSKIKSKGEKILKEIENDIHVSGEAVIMSPQGASFNGADKTHGRVKCNGVIAATDKRILFRRLIGKPIDINRDEIIRVSKEKWFHKSSKMKLLHLVIHLKDENKVAFYVRDCDLWIAQISPRLYHDD